MAINLSSIVVNIGAEVSGFVGGLGKAIDATARFSDRVRNISSQMMGFGAGLVAFGSGILLFLFKAADTLKDFALQPGLGIPEDEVTSAAAEFKEMEMAVEDAKNSLIKSVGPRVVEDLKPVVGTVTDLADKFVNLDKSTKDSLIDFALFGSITAILAGGLLLLGGSIAGAITSIIGLASAFGLQLAPAIASAAGTLFLPLTVAIAAFVVLWATNWGNFRKHVDDVIQAVKKILDGFVSIFKGIFEILVGIIELDGDKIGKGFEKLWQGAVDIATAILWDLPTTVLGFFYDLLAGVWNWGNKLGAILADAFLKAKDWVFDIVADLINGVLSTMANLFNGVIDTVNRIIRAINSIPGGPKFGEIGLIASPPKVTGSQIQGALGQAAGFMMNPAGAITNVVFNNPVVRDQADFDELVRKFDAVISGQIKSRTAYGV